MDEFEGPGQEGGAGGAVARVVGAVQHRDFREIERAQAFQAGGVDAVLLRVRAALVVGIDAAAGAEIMLGAAGVELVAGEGFGPLGDVDILKLGGECHGAAHAAERAVAAPCGTQAIGEFDGKAHSTAMAGGLDGGSIVHGGAPAVGAGSMLVWGRGIKGAYLN